MLRGVILGVHVLLALMIIGLVLLQRGKGAEAGAGFGSGASGTVFGARGTSTLFSKLTAVFAGLFFVTSLSLAYLGSHAPAQPTSVLERAAQAAAPSKAPPPALTPSAPPTPVTAPATPPQAAPETTPTAPEKK
ncbi:MAG: preprotein translocase subunit SecG [Gammaproteobacteria bacterium]|jgi:preprotein translocase subunit SecG|nr:preprotein translocase subunit SecG [Gammaproteobacteria bacterium]MEA3141919.1 preprotein translocase subunit SecG [Gammaproteobacteria bacterium]